MYNISLMKNDSAKIIQNYSLQQLTCVHPDQSQFYKSTNIILKKPFTIRKIKHDQTSKQVLTSIVIKKNQTQTVYSQIKAQIDLNKSIQKFGVPRCHKLIRTYHHFYIVYDEFPKLNLKQHILTNILTKHQKIELFIKIVSTLKAIHKMGVAVIGISAQTIRVDDEGNIFFTDLSQARFLTSNCLANTSQLPPFYAESLPDEFIDFGRWGTYTDVYMLGKLFNKIIKCSSVDSSQRYKRLFCLFSDMTQSQYQNRLRLEDVQVWLQNQKNNKQRKDSGQLKVDHLMIPSLNSTFHSSQKSRPYSVRSFSDNSVSYQTQRQPSNRYKLFEISTMNIDVKIEKSVQFNENMLVAPKLGSICEIKSAKQVGRNALTPISLNSQRRLATQNPKITRKISQTINKVVKYRNLAFFLLDLSQFVMRQWIVPELGYLMVKQANLILESCLEKLQIHQNSEFQEKQLYQIVFGQKLKIAVVQTKVRQIFIKQQIEERFRKELIQDHCLNDEYFQSKILEFAKMILSQLDQPSEQKKTMRDIAQKLSKVYMILKKIEMESYQRFWDETYNMKYASLENQRYIKEEKMFGYHYLRRKIQNILKNK